ncbi:hypothetical protein ABW19_dt0209865 [Dactylella cylindrospora]|nr:hypothetical protein ABW19_dt0209865 [Dactylella cylindrospora]
MSDRVSGKGECKQNMETEVPEGMSTEAGSTEISENLSSEVNGSGEGLSLEELVEQKQIDETIAASRNVKRQRDHSPDTEDGGHEEGESSHQAGKRVRLN